MKKIGILEGTLDELFRKGCPEPEPFELEGHNIIRKAFAGEPRDGLFRGIDPDTGVELFFNDQEMLARFTSLTKPDQEIFSKTVREVMEREDVDVIRLTVRWSKADTKVVTISKVNDTGPLNVFI